MVGLRPAAPSGLAVRQRCAGRAPPLTFTATIAAALNGFLLGASLIVAIGAQNAFVLRQGLKHEFVFIVCLICSLSDALLIAVGVAGFGTLVARSHVLLFWVTIAGALFLFEYGVLSFRRAVRSETMQPSEAKPSLRAAIATCLALTFLNPHVYLDTVLLIGSLSGRHAGAARFAYAIGAALASFVWFFGLGYGAALLQPIFADRRAWRILDIVIGIVMWAIAARLVAALFG
jgi:L-lysine exporter family protein LysE/ArgO